MSQRVTLWRVSNYASLEGIGGMFAGGRWHTKGHPVLYCSEDPSTALLETLVHLEVDIDDRPNTFQVLKIESSLAVSMEIVKGLEPGWPDDLMKTQQLGDEWLDSQRTLLLQVRSILVPERRNYLVNPLHAQHKMLHISAQYTHPSDLRLVRSE